MAIYALEVVLLAAGPGNGKAEFEEDGQSRKGEDAADQP